MSLAVKLDHPATYADLEALPPGVKGEIIDGELYVQPRPRAAHAKALGRIVGKVGDSYDFGNGGPGGWWILPEPGIELPNLPEFSPDAAGWHRTVTVSRLVDGAWSEVAVHGEDEKESLAPFGEVQMDLPLWWTE